MPNLRIDYISDTIIFRTRRPAITWISREDRVEWQTDDFPSVNLVGNLLDWVLHERILMQLDKLLIQSPSQNEKFRYFRNILQKLTPDTEWQSAEAFRSQIECRLTDEFSDYQFELNDISRNKIITDLSKFYMYLALHIPGLDFITIPSNSSIINICNCENSVKELMIPNVLELRKIDWKARSNASSFNWINAVRSGFDFCDQPEWFYFENGFDLHILSCEQWTIWLRGELNEWEIALIVINMIKEVYTPIENFDSVFADIKRNCCIWPNSSVEVSLF